MDEMDQMIERLEKKYEYIERHLKENEYNKVIWMLFHSSYTIDNVVSDDILYDKRIVDKYYETHDVPTEAMIVDYLMNNGNRNGADYEFFNSVMKKKTYQNQNKMTKSM